MLDGSVSCGDPVAIAAQKVFWTRASGVRDVAEALVDLYAAERTPGDGHLLLADVHPDIVVTTNYDNLIEAAMSQRLRDPVVVRHDDELEPFPASRPMVIKLHGDAKTLQELLRRPGVPQRDELHSQFVLSATQYHDFFRDRPLMVLLLKLCWAQRRMIVIGQSLREPNLWGMFCELGYALASAAGATRWPDIYWIDADSTDKPPDLLQHFNITVVPCGLGTFLRGVTKHRRQIARESEGRLVETIDTIVDSASPQFIRNWCAATVASDFPIELLYWQVPDRETVQKQVGELQSLGCILPSDSEGGGMLCLERRLRARVNIRIRSATDGRDGWLSDAQSLAHWKHFVTDKLGDNLEFKGSV